MRLNLRIVAACLAILTALGTGSSALATQYGAGLHYLRALGDIKDEPGVDENAFALFGSVSMPLAMIMVEGNVEFVPDYLGSENMLVEPAVYGLLDAGMLYGGLGIGIGYLDGEWASNPFYALRAGLVFGSGGLAFDVFASYRFQSATYDEVRQNFDMDMLTFAAQIKFGG